jgi:hypothetical protein
MKFELDWWSLAFGAIVSLLANSLSYFGKLNKVILRWAIRRCITVPKTNKFKVLKNKPLKRIRDHFPRDATELTAILNSIRRDPNLRFSGLFHDVCLIIQCLFDDRDELFVDTMDFLVVSKLGVEILIFKFERPPSSEKFDRSLYIDITAYRSTVIQFHGWFAFGVGFLALFVSGNDELRSALQNAISM